VFFGRFVAFPSGAFAALLAGVNRMPLGELSLGYNAAGGICWAALFGFRRPTHSGNHMHMLARRRRCSCFFFCRRCGWRGIVIWAVLLPPIRGRKLLRRAKAEKNRLSRVATSVCRRTSPCCPPKYDETDDRSEPKTPQRPRGCGSHSRRVDRPPWRLGEVRRACLEVCSSCRSAPRRLLIALVCWRRVAIVAPLEIARVVLLVKRTRLVGQADGRSPGPAAFDRDVCLLTSFGLARH